MPVYLKQVATIQDGLKHLRIMFLLIWKSKWEILQIQFGISKVTISVAKVKSYAMQISGKIITKRLTVKKNIIPTDVHVEVSRNMEKTASHKVGELLLHLGVAIIAVTVLVMLAMGWEED